MSVRDWNNRIWELLDSVRVNEISDTYALAMVDDITAKARFGEVYHFSYLWEGVTDQSNVDILVRTGARRVSIQFGVAAGAASQFRLYEEPTISDAGTALTKVNRNRMSSVTFTSAIYYDPTFSASGTELAVDYLPGGVKNKEVGATSSATAVWLLKPNTDYLLNIVNISGGSEDVAIFGDIFEDAV